MILFSEGVKGMGERNEDSLMCKAKKCPYESNDIKTIYIIPKKKEIKVTYGTEMELKFCGDNMIYMKETVSLA